MAKESLQMRFTIIVFITVIGVVWTNGLRPYKSLYLNFYMGVMEFLYLACIVFFILFTDILPEIPAKVVSSIIFFVIIVTVMLINLAYGIYLLIKDRNKYKDEVQEYKMERMLLEFER